MRIVVADEKSQLVEVDAKHGQALGTTEEFGILRVNHIPPALTNGCEGGPHPEERALARVSKDGRESALCVHPSRRLLRKLLRMRSEIYSQPRSPGRRWS